MDKLTNGRMWLHGILAAFINGAAGGIVLTLVDPHDFNLQDGWKKLLSVAATFGILAAANYVKQTDFDNG